MFSTFFGSETAMDSKAFRNPLDTELIPIWEQNTMQESLDDHGMDQSYRLIGSTMKSCLRVKRSF
jgi:hypothetical protein